MSSPAKVSVPEPEPPKEFRPLAACQAVCVPEKAHTLAGFREWSRTDTFPEHARISFIAGEIFIDMSGEELHTHNRLKAELQRVLGNLDVELQLGMIFADGAQIANEAAGLCNIPDLVFVTWESLVQGRVREIPRARNPDQAIELEGSPDLVVEIVSNSSVAKDTGDLRRTYHKAGIPEYWLIDARGAEVDFQILHHRRTGYVAVPVRGGWRRSRIFGRSFRLERTRGRLSRWVYRLHVQPAGR